MRSRQVLPICRLTLHGLVLLELARWQTGLLEAVLAGLVVAGSLQC